MRILRIPAAFLLITAFVVGCTDQPIPTESSDAGPASTLAFTEHAGNTLLGSWRLVSAMQGDTDLLAGGVSLVQTLRSDDTFSWLVRNDLGFLVCTSPQTSCTVSGPYTTTSTIITINDDSFVYALVCGRLLMGDADEEGAMLVFKRTGPPTN